MKSVLSLLQLFVAAFQVRAPRMRESRVARIERAARNRFVYDENRFHGLPNDVANAYTRFADKSREAAQQRLF